MDARPSGPGTERGDLTTIVSELCEALRKAGVDDQTALRAARSVIAIEHKEHLATARS